MIYWTSVEANGTRFDARVEAAEGNEPTRVYAGTIVEHPSIAAEAHSIEELRVILAGELEQYLENPRDSAGATRSRRIP